MIIRSEAAERDSRMESKENERVRRCLSAKVKSILRVITLWMVGHGGTYPVHQAWFMNGKLGRYITSACADNS